MTKRLFISILAALMSFLGLKAAQVALVTEINNYGGEAPLIQFEPKPNSADSYSKEISQELKVELNNLKVQRNAFSFLTQSTFNVNMTGDCTVATILFADVYLIDELNPIVEANGIGKLEHLSEVTSDTRYVDILWTGPAQQNLSFRFKQDSDIKHILITYDSTAAPEKEEFSPGFMDLTLSIDEIYPLNITEDAPVINFSTTNASVATAEKRGDGYIVNARGPGETIIEAKWDETARWKSGTAEFNVKVTDPAPARQDFMPGFTTLSLIVGDTHLLELPTDAPDMAFESSNPKVAAVTNYSVCATDVGTTTITATWEQTDKWNSGRASFNVNVSPIPTTKQDFIPDFKDLDLYIGETHALNLPPDAPNVTFSSSNMEIATVENGIVKANGAGETTVVATWVETEQWKAGSAFFKVTVSVPASPKQDFNPGFTPLSLTVGENHALNLPQDAPEINYSSSETSVATVEDNMVKAYRAGEAVIAAVWDENDRWKSGSATFVVTVTEPLPQKQDFDPGFTDISLTAGDSHVLNLPQDAPAIQYSTSNAAVASVENNTVFAKTAGEAVIAAIWADNDRWKSGSATFVVTVTEPLPQKQDFVPGFTDISLTAGDSHALNLPQDAPAIQYSTSNAAVASVENNTVIAKTPGETTIAATWNETDKWKSGTAVFRVTVNDASGPADPMLRFQHSEVRGQIGWGAISQAATHLGEGHLSYSSSDAKIAEVDANTGQIIKVNREGQAIITATLAASTNYKAATASYILKVESAPTDRDFKFDRISSGGFARTPFTLNRINKNYVQYTIDGLQRYDYSIVVNDDILEVTVRNEGIYTLRASAADGTGYALMQLVIFPCIEITPTGGMIDPEHSDVVLFEATGGSVKIGFNNSPMYMVYIDNVPFSVAEIPVANDMSVYYTLRYASMPFNVGAWLHLIIKPYAPSYRYDTASGQYIINSDEGHILYRILDGSGTENWIDTGSTELRLGKEHFAGKESIDIQLKTRKPTKRPGYEAESGISTYTLSASGSTGIEDVLDDNEAPSQLYDLNGRLITTDTPAPGIYILKRGSKTTKVYIK